MAVSSIRTLVWQPPLIAAPRPLIWPTAQPDDDLDYSIDLTAWLADVRDDIVSASWSAKPSGSGELQIANLVVAGAVATVWLSGGVAGRGYLVKSEFVTAGGRTLELILRLGIAKTLAVYPLPAPSSSGFGTAVTWPPAGEGSGLDFSNSLNSGFIPTL